MQGFNGAYDSTYFDLRSRRKTKKQRKIEKGERVGVQRFLKKRNLLQHISRNEISTGIKTGTVHKIKFFSGV